MDCRKFRRKISRVLDGELDGAERGNLEGHLASCEGCRRFRDMTLAGLSMHRSMKEADPPPSLLPSIMVAVEVGPPRGWMSGWIRIAIPAAATATAVFGFWIGVLVRESFVPVSAGNKTDVLELSYLDEYPPGSMGAILMTSNEGGGDE